MARYGLFEDFLSDLNQEKKNILRQDPDAEKDFQPFIVNRALSMNRETIMYANEMNINNHLSKGMIYDFYIHAIRSRKRWAPWAKGAKDDEEYFIVALQERYAYNRRRAEEVLPLLDKKQKSDILKQMDKGGQSDG